MPLSDENQVFCVKGWYRVGGADVASFPGKIQQRGTNREGWVGIVDGLILVCPLVILVPPVHSLASPLHQTTVVTSDWKSVYHLAGPPGVLVSYVLWELPILRTG
jgi:hypothetical protein